MEPTNNETVAREPSYSVWEQMKDPMVVLLGPPVLVWMAANIYVLVLLFQGKFR
jgi:hypothetical protein